MKLINQNQEINISLFQINIDNIVTAILTVFSMFTGKTPKFKAHGGTPIENMALQNIQVRF